MVRPKPGLLRLKALRVLYENTEDGKVYAWNKLMEILTSGGIGGGYASQLLWDFYLLGILERPKRGLYKVNKGRLKEYLDRYEAMIKFYVDLYESTAVSLRGGGSGGPAPSQG
jgi:hypothetical protein